MSYQFTNRLIYNPHRMDGPVAIVRNSYEVTKDWTHNNDTIQHRADGHANIFKWSNVTKLLVTRIWSHYDEVYEDIQNMFDEHGIDTEDMSEQDILIVQMHLGAHK